MADIEITDEASLEAWLKTRPRRDAEIIAFRAAARVFPLWGRAMEEEWAVDGSNTAIDILGILLMRHCFDEEKKSFSESSIRLRQAHQFKFLERSKVNSGAALAAFVSTEHSYYLVDTHHDIASELEKPDYALWINSFVPFEDLGREQREIYWKNLDAEAKSLATKGSLNSLPLWPTPAPHWFTTADAETRAIWAKDPSTWAFWEKWWDGVISGDMPFSPDLLRDVALIDDDIWQAGPKAVAERINLLIQRHALQREAAAINARLMEFIALNEGLGANLHNQPPDEELSPVKLRATLREISQALKDIEVALDGPEISPEVVVGLGQRLKDLWDGLTTKMKFAIGGLAIVCVTGFSQFSSGFMGAAGEDFYQLAKRNIDIPSFSRRLLDFGKQLEKQPKPAPVFPQRTPVDL